MKLSFGNSPRLAGVGRTVSVLLALSMVVLVACLAALPATTADPDPAQHHHPQTVLPVPRHDQWIDLKDYCNRDPLGHKGKRSVIRRFATQAAADRVFYRWDERGIQPTTFGFICEIWQLHIYRGGRHWRMSGHIDFR